MNDFQLQNLTKLKQHGCKACIFCNSEDDGFGSQLLECRLKAPVFDHGMENYTAVFPQVEPNEWCSEGYCIAQ